MNVEWKEINPDYIVSSDGQVGSRKRGKFRMLKPTRNSNGYMVVNLLDGGGGQRTYLVHHLVATAFLGPKPTPKHEVNHKSGVRDDNHDHNLEWVTRTENLRHRFDVLKHGNTRGEARWNSKLTEVEVREIRRRCAAGEAQKSVAADYGISEVNVSHIATRRGWAWLDTDSPPTIRRRAK